jgi:hypothetical protein
MQNDLAGGAVFWFMAVAYNGLYQCAQRLLIEKAECPAWLLNNLHFSLYMIPDGPIPQQKNSNPIEANVRLNASRPPRASWLQVCQTERSNHQNVQSTAGKRKLICRTHAALLHR